MSAQVGNAPRRVYESMLDDFYLCTERACERFADLCESPIEVMFGAALGLAGNLAKPGVVAVLKQGEPAPTGAIISLVPQYVWGGYRFDFAVIASWATVLVECDGHDFHERTKEQAERDRGKDRAAQDAGFWILRFTGSEIYRSPANCATQVLNFIARRR